MLVNTNVRMAANRDPVTRPCVSLQSCDVGTHFFDRESFLGQPEVIEKSLCQLHVARRKPVKSIPDILRYAEFCNVFV